ncbi:ribokinase [Aquibacillus koreensis]|uniref:Ribokinase n=1 Tax=Aquibacillus koreensis TaxID=279446 RepID=A0A9X3WGV2_9BACI|nr:ribokinase [Aquibacillus koreensis]MCT2534738.1 ribokinase [Aquibacillus koreensis]MDC3419652.1 ribokinase [Aquibacillus koreensis]
MNNELDILLYGSLNMDFVSFVKQLPMTGETVAADTFLMSPGGKAANQAVASARLGAKVGLVGRVGSDYLGKEMKQALEQEGVVTDYVLETDYSETGTAVVTVNSQGENTIVTNKGANAFLSKDDITKSETILKRAKATILQLEMEQDEAEWIIQQAKNNDKVVVLNLAPVVPIRREVLGLVDLLIVNEVEAAQLTGVPVNSVGSAILASKELREIGIDNVVVTLGAQGAVLHNDQVAKQFIPPQVEVVDSTAAGDCFVAALTTFWMKTGDLEKSVEDAVLVSALSVTKKGAQTSLPTFSDYESFLERGVSNG